LAIDNIEFDVRTGEFLTVVGPSGCGKSTLLLCVAGLVRPSGGAVLIDGRPVLDPQADIGVVFQDDLLMPWRHALGNVMIQGELRGMAPQALRERSKQLLSMVGLSEFTGKYPQELSGGMRQRVAICRALVHDPSLLLMDEPFGALDAFTRDQLNIDLQHIWASSRKTVVFVTHSIVEAVFLADRVLVLSSAPGKVTHEVSVPLPRPRSLDMQDTREFNEITRAIRKLFTSMGVIRSHSNTPT